MVGNGRGHIALGNQVDVVSRDFQRANDRIEQRVDTADNVGIRTLYRIRIGALGQLPVFRSVGQVGQHLLQRLQNLSHLVDGNLHLFVVALVGLCDQFVDLALGDLSQDAIPFADGQKNGVEHFIDAAHDLGVGAGKLLGLATFAELAFMRCDGEAAHFLLQALQNDGDVVDGDLHFFVIALVGLGDQFVDLSS